MGAGYPAGRRPLLVHGPPAAPHGDGPDGGTWSRHATGFLTAPGATTAPGNTGPWPPAGAEEVPAETVHDRLTAAGLHHGPALKTLARLWVRGEEVFAEARLSDELHSSAGGYALHPALLDTAVQALAAVTATGDAAGREALVWRGVRLHAAGADAVRLRITPDGADTVSVELADDQGAPVATVEALVTRQLDAERFTVAPDGVHDALFRLDWVRTAVPARAAATTLVVISGAADATAAALGGAGVPVATYEDLAALDAAITAGRQQMPDTVVVPFTTATAAPEQVTALLAQEVREATHRALATVQSWLDNGRFAGARLAFVTRGAVAAHQDTEAGDLAHAPVWGL
ncbi:polyketide synthase dehydratase domain-containing protein, partial [Streptomyces goshikiensis]|uniref:polyketide synthase dehydratase domain-containing protein n=1 Tax=Streptomyces goshikiensis TaxID=1942 RepID=UPI003654FB6D